MPQDALPSLSTLAVGKTSIKDGRTTTWLQSPFEYQLYDTRVAYVSAGTYNADVHTADLVIDTDERLSFFEQVDAFVQREADMGQLEHVKSLRPPWREGATYTKRVKLTAHTAWYEQVDDTTIRPTGACADTLKGRRVVVAVKCTSLWTMRRSCGMTHPVTAIVILKDSGKEEAKPAGSPFEWARVQDE